MGHLIFLTYPIILCSVSELYEEIHRDECLERILIGGVARLVDKLPKTWSGKIMRRVLKAKELGKELGDLSTLED